MDNKRLREVDPKEDQTTLCKLCFRPAQAPDWDEDDADDTFQSAGRMRLGPLYEYTDAAADVVYCAHYFCLLFSSGLEQAGGDEEGIQGFLPADISREWYRGQRLKCCYCDRKYATVGCSVKGCRRSYHAPCAISAGCLLRFADDFPSFCHAHRPWQDRPGRAKSDNTTCGVCLRDVVSEGSALWGPCCGGRFHLSCLDRLAQSSGYFFKCPLCNNKVEFEMEMKSFGVFVPEQDAAWELDDNAFESLLSRHGTCDADLCVCPRGRTEDVDDTPWEILLCKCCGAQGVHAGCRTKGGLDLDCPWTCGSCDNVVSKMAPTALNVYSPFATSSSASTGDRVKQSEYLSSATFFVKNGVVGFDTQEYRVTTKLENCPHFEEEQEAEARQVSKLSCAKKQMSILDYMNAKSKKK